MKFGFLSDLFEGVGAKHLSEVEVNKLRSHQHEFQGVGGFRAFLGSPADKKTYSSTFYWLDDQEEQEVEPIISFCTWSDVRRSKPGRSPEYHLYYSAESDPVVHCARAGDLLVIARTKSDRLLVFLCRAKSTIAWQLQWLFGLDLLAGRTDAKHLSSGSGPELGYAARSVLRDLSIEFDEPEPDGLEQLINLYGDGFPGTVEFSAFARDALSDVEPREAPDEALVAWMEHEELLFRHLERRIVAKRLIHGFMVQDGADVDGFISFSLSVQNRRKSRAGWAFGHHVQAVLEAQDLRFKREATTEKRNGPDFLFPGETEYHDTNFDDGLLTMLAIKTSCKDRWRQVLAEANRIERKHLLTLQPGISEAQTSEMMAENLQLVVPKSIQGSYQADQQAWLMSLREFLEYARQIERRILR